MSCGLATCPFHRKLKPSHDTNPGQEGCTKEHGHLHIHTHSPILYTGTHRHTNINHTRSTNCRAGKTQWMLPVCAINELHSKSNLHKHTDSSRCRHPSHLHANSTSRYPVKNSSTPPGGSSLWILQTFLTAACTYSPAPGVVRAKCTVTGNWREATWITFGGVGKRRGFSVKSSIRSVALMMTSLRGEKWGEVGELLDSERRRRTIRDKRPVGGAGG